MADPMDIDQSYLATRKAMARWQQQQIEQVSSGGDGTMQQPSTSLTVGKPKSPTGKQPQAGEDETLAPPFHAHQGEWTSEPPIHHGLQALGKGGKKLGEAIKPGVVTAARGIGMDETQAETTASALVEFLAGLPGADTGDESAGVETGLAALPAVGMTLKGAKAAKKASMVTVLTEEQQLKLQSAHSNFQEQLKSFSEQLSTQRRGVRSDVQVTADSRSPDAMQFESYLNLPPGTILKDSDVVAVKRMFKELSEPATLIAKHLTKNPKDEQAFLALLEQLPMISRGLKNIAGVYAESGRTQRLLSEKLPTGGNIPSMSKEQVRISDPYIQQWMEFFKQQEALDKMGAPSMPREKFVQILASIKSPQEMARLAQIAANPSKWDMFLEYWINGLLSGPQTHVVNALSNTATIAWGIPERAIAAMLSPSVRPSETTAMIGGVKDSIGDAWRLAWKAFKEEETQLGHTKMEGPSRAITGDALELTGLPGRAVDLLGQAIRLPGRALLASDDFFKAIAFRAEVRALARRESLRAVQESGLSGRAAVTEMRKIESRILANPPEHIEQAAQEYAAYVTFTRELGETGAKVQLALTTPIGRIMVPFVRTPTNIFKFAGERTPFALLSKAVREEIAAGGERRALALAKIGLGSMTMGYIGTLAAEGLITGGGPKDKVLRERLKETGWQPYSVRVGDTYYSYARTEPLGSLIGLAADAADLMGQLPQRDAEYLAAALVVAIQRNVANKTFVKGLAGSLNAVTSQDINVVQSFFEKELPTLLPYSTGMAQTARTVDPVMREVSSIMDAFKARVPGYSDTLPPHRDLFSNPVLFQGGLGPDLVSSIYSSKAVDDPVAQEIAKQEIPVGLPSKQINRVPLTAEEYDAYSILAGSKPIIGGQTLHQRLEGLFQSDLYRRASSGPDGGKWQLIRQWVAAYREQAATMLMTGHGVQEQLGTTYPELAAKIRAKRQEEAMRFRAENQ